MTDKDVSRVAVVGAGTMGSGIAGEFARAGCTVKLVDLDAGLLERGMESIRGAQAVLVEAGSVAQDLATQSLGRIETTSELDVACTDADLVVEAITEELTAKQALFQKLDAICSSTTVLASNTSGLSITKIGEPTGRPELVVGMHFWNPPHIIPLVEVTKGAATSDATAELLMSTCRRLGKRPILVRHDIPGFVGNRLQYAVMREALHLVSEGIVTAEDVDTAMTAGPGLRYGFIGPLRTADLGGLDVFHAICDYLFAELDARQDSPALLADLVAQGKLGAKSGQGFYDYSGDELSRQLRTRDRVLLGFLDVLKRETAGLM